MPESIQPTTTAAAADSTTQPRFAEPWQVCVFAMAQLLIDAGVIFAKDWSEALGSERAAGEPQADDRDAYYRSCLQALENLLHRQAILDKTSIARQTEKWRAAHLEAAHGEPVQIAPTS